MNTDDHQLLMDRVISRPENRVATTVARLHSHHLIQSAAGIAAERVGTIMDGADTASRKVDALNAWIDFIDKNAIIEGLTPPNAARLQIFKTTNDRAQRMTQADMIKSHLFEHAS